MKYIVRIPYQGSALPGNAEVVTFLNTVTAFPGANFCAMWGLGRLVISVVNDQTGTLNLYRYASDRLAANRTKIYTVAVAASAANSSNPYDIRIGEFGDFAVEWVNGATPQTSFKVDVALYPLGVPTV